MTGEGMPINNDKEEPKMHLLNVEELPKGNLYIKFDIIFPKKLSEMQKEKIVKTLQEAKELEEAEEDE